MHGLESTVSLAADGGSSLTGGNWQIFEQFVKRSGAQIFLKTEVGQLLFFPGETSNIDAALGGWHRTPPGPHLESCYQRRKS